MASPTPLEGVTIVFDLDGTLVDTAPDLVAALNACLTDAGYEPVHADSVKGQIGLGSKAMIETALETLGQDVSDKAVDNMRAALIAYYGENIAGHSAPYPDCVDALDRLELAGAEFAICTNKPQDLADALLKALGLHHRFKAIVGSDSVPARKPDPAHILRTLELSGGQPTRAIMVGDSNPDERAARDAGLPFVFIPFGYGPIDTSEHPRIELASYTALSPTFILSLL